MICNQSIKESLRLLGRTETLWILRCARQMETTEAKWLRKLREKIASTHKEVVKSLLNGAASPDTTVSFVEFLFAHGADVLRQSQAEKRSPSLPLRMARPKQSKTLKDWMEAWDLYRKKGTIPRKISKNANDIKKKYLDGCRDVFNTYARDFREGKEFTKDQALKDIQKAADTTFKRAKVIVETETTSYYNKARNDIYDQSDDVTHYLMLSIRDQRTSKWCNDKVNKEGRGRHGLVYKKGDPLTKKETPALHWFCRSELIPLTPHNPRHLRLINDESLARRNNKCTPLPKGWAA